MVEPLSLYTADQQTLEAEISWPEETLSAGVVLCHPHPLHGGSMRSIVTSELFTQLPTRNVATLRFNFRGIGESSGTHGDGELERLDGQAALEELKGRLPASTPLVLVGWSFGAGVAISISDVALAGWALIAPSFTSAIPDVPAGPDPRPKLVIFAEHDATVDNPAAEETITNWTNTTTQVIAGADHYFIGRTQQVVSAVVTFIESLQV